MKLSTGDIFLMQNYRHLFQNLCNRSCFNRTRDFEADNGAATIENDICFLSCAQRVKIEKWKGN